MRTLVIAGLLFSLSACRDKDGGDTRVDTVYTGSSGEVALSDGETLRFSITSEKYKQWEQARSGLDKRITSRFGALLQPSSPSARTIDAAVAYLESEPKARDAIANAGMSVRDFVITTVALEQEMRLASGRGSQREPEFPPYPAYVDSTFVPDTFARIPPPVLPLPTAPVVRQYLDTFPRPDTSLAVPRRDSVIPPRTESLPPRQFPVADSIAREAARRDSAVRSDTARKRDSVVKRDTLVIKRDSVVPRPRKDTLVVKPPPDTTRDTLSRRMPRT